MHACIYEAKKHGLHSLNKPVSVTVINMHLNATWSTKNCYSVKHEVEVSQTSQSVQCTVKKYHCPI